MAEPSSVTYRFVPVRRFTVREVQLHLTKNHSYCPDTVLIAVTNLVVSRSWLGGQTLGFAVGIALQAHLRHNYTAYDRRVREPGADVKAIKRACNREGAELMKIWRGKHERRAKHAAMLAERAAVAGKET